MRTVWSAVRQESTLKKGGKALKINKPKLVRIHRWSIDFFSAKVEIIDGCLREHDVGSAFLSRQEATKAAIEKANELYNERVG